MDNSKMWDAFKSYQHSFFSPLKDVQDSLRSDLLRQSQDQVLLIFAGLYEFPKNNIKRSFTRAVDFTSDLANSRRFMFRVLGTTVVLPVLQRLLTTSGIKNKEEILIDVCEISQTEFLLFLCEYASRNDFFNCNVKMQNHFFHKLWSELANPQHRQEIDQLHLKDHLVSYPEQFLIFWDLVYHQRSSYLIKLLDREDLLSSILKSILTHVQFNPSDWEQLENYLHQKLRAIIPSNLSEEQQIDLGPNFKRLQVVIDWLINKHPVDPLKWYQLYIDWYKITNNDEQQFFGFNDTEPSRIFFKKYFSILLAHPEVSQENKITLCEILENEGEKAKLLGETGKKIEKRIELAESELNIALRKNSLRALFELIRGWINHKNAPPAYVIQDLINLQIVRYHSNLQQDLERLCKQYNYTDLVDKIISLQMPEGIYKGSRLTPISLQALVDQNDFDQLKPILDSLRDNTNPNPEFCPILKQIMALLPGIKNFDYRNIVHTCIWIFRKCNYYSVEVVVPLLRLFSYDIHATRIGIEYIMDVPGIDFLDELSSLLKQKYFLDKYLPAKVPEYSFGSHEIGYLFILIAWKDPSRLIPILKEVLQVFLSNGTLLLQEMVTFLLNHPELDIDPLLDLCIGFLITSKGDIPLDDIFYNFPRTLPIHSILRDYVSAKLQDPGFPITIHTVSLVAALNLEWPAPIIDEIFALVQEPEIINHALQAQLAFQPNALKSRLDRFRVPDGWYRAAMDAALKFLEGRLEDHTFYIDPKKYSGLTYYEAIQTLYNLKSLRDTDFPAYRAQYMRCIRPNYTKLKDDIKLVPEIIPPTYPHNLPDLLKREEFLQSLKVLSPLKLRKENLLFS